MTDTARTTAEIIGREINDLEQILMLGPPGSRRGDPSGPLRR